jgi:hypothetical protein
MKWVHNAEDYYQWEAWTLVMPGHPNANDKGEVLLAIDFQRKGVHEWQVRPVGANKTVGTIPYDTPEEELKALAIAMWRLG